MGEYYESPPRAAMLVESLRDFGYSLAAALADVVDNSLSAGATDISLHADIAGNTPAIAIVDNGAGMSREELLTAMRLGSRSPLDPRPANDLGRFGLGLKTASFSQCRRLTVVARKDGETTIAVWDLDHIAGVDRWELLLPPSGTGVPFFQELEGDGALVVWEKLDRVLGMDVTEEARQDLVQRLADASAHLELVFHRYLAGEAGLKRVQVSLNQRLLEPFDPFCSSHPATERRSTEVFAMADGAVEITAFTLPHHRNVSEAEWRRFGGVEGYLRNQGFYLYRNRRLILHGTWFGLARQSEFTKLARIRLDIPNSADAAWHVDVRKASAHPPLAVRRRLRLLVDGLGAASKRIFQHRGRTLHDSRIPLWRRAQKDNSIAYHLNGENPLLSEFRATLTARQQRDFDRLATLIAGSLPLDAIYVDLAGSQEQLRPADVDDDALVVCLKATVQKMREGGIAKSKVARMLHSLEPFRSNWERTESLLPSELQEFPHAE